MKKPTTSGSDIFLVGQLAAAVSIASFFYYLKQGDLLLYGDAVAHINIARRVFDSRTPGLWQLGTVWLPLPHLLMLPFVVSRWLWQTGIGGSIPSLFAYVVSVIGIFRLMQTVLALGDDGALRGPGSGFAPWLAAGVFALNPNLIYLETTAMTEPLYLAFFIWATVFFCGALRGGRAGELKKANASLLDSGLFVAAACLTRYDGWFLAAVMVLAALLLAWRLDWAPLRPAVRKFVLLAAALPALWLAYNAILYRNPLEFANGPYSAKAIEQKTATSQSSPHPGTRNLPVAFRYFLKAAELNLGVGKWQIFWIGSLLVGTASVVLFQRRFWPLLLFWTPVPFYMASIAYAGVPLFVPVWWPYSRYNLRYGLEMLPAFAVFTAAAAYALMRFAATTKAQLAIAMVFLLVAAASYIQVWRRGAISFEEARINSRTRIALETALAKNLEMLPPNATFLMYLGDHVGAFQQAGIPLSHVINESNHRPWKLPADPDGLWERALKNPAAYANYVITFDSGPVAAAVNKRELEALTILRVTGQPEAIIYKTVKSNQTR
jgi:hypothetical protein